MTKKLLLVLFPCMLLLLNSCSGTFLMYHLPKLENTERSTDLGPISIFVELMNNQKTILPFSYFQPVFPLKYEKYNVWFMVSRDNRENEQDDIMRSMYFDDVRIVLPSGKIIDLLEGKIDVTYTYLESGKETGIPYKTLENVKPQYIDGVKKLFLDGIKDGDWNDVWFYTKIPSSFDRIYLEYTLTIEWENMGTVKRRTKMIFDKQIKRWVFPTA